MAKVTYKEVFITDVKSYCENNSVLDFKEIKFSESKKYEPVASIEMTTKKGKLIFVGLSMSKWKALYCSCTNIKTTHHTVVANIFKSAIQKADITFQEVKE